MTTLTQRPAVTPKSSWLAALGFLAAVAAVAVIGSLAATSSAEIYGTLNQPAWAPPTWLFGPVWTVLYLMIAAAGWLYWRAAGWTRALVPYAVNLVLNALWTPLFFGAGAFGLALVDLIALDVLTIATIVFFARRSRPAAWLLAPYLAWTLFATALNAALIVLN